MTGIVVLRLADTTRMAHLHSAAFPQSEAWSTQAFTDLMALDSVLAFGIEGDRSLTSLIVFQNAAPQSEILTFATTPIAQRKGHATSLLSGCLKFLNQRGIHEILLEVAEDNRRARAFYERNGFKETGRRKGYYRRADGSRIDAILMSLTSTGHTTPKRA